MTDSPRYWFPAKRYGFGWGFPTAWQGRVVLGLYVVLIAAAALLFDASAQPLRFAACASALTLVLLGICWSKGEPPRWRWGRGTDR